MKRYGMGSLSPKISRVSASLRNSPQPLNCKGENLELIKENLILAAETISQLRIENQNIRNSLQKQYDEKISSLELECEYLKLKTGSVPKLKSKKIE